MSDLNYYSKVPSGYFLLCQNFSLPWKRTFPSAHSNEYKYDAVHCRTQFIYYEEWEEIRNIETKVLKDHKVRFV